MFQNVWGPVPRWGSCSLALSGIPSLLALLDTKLFQLKT